MATTKRAAKQPQFVPEAAQPGRAYRSTSIQWGLISLPVDLFSQTEQQKTPRSSFVKAEDGSFHPAGKQDYDKTTGDKIDSADIVKGVEVDGKVIEISDEELKLSTEYGQSRLLGFLDHSQIYQDPNMVLTNHYQVRPSLQRVGNRDRRVNHQAEKVFGLLKEGLANANKVALLELSVQDGAAHKLGILDHNGTIKILVSQELVRIQRPVYEVEVNQDELKLIDDLIRRDTLKVVPEFHDDSIQKIRELVDLKSKGKALPRVAAAKEKENEGTDMMAALQASLRK